MKKYQIIVVDPPWSVKKLTHPDRPKQVDMDYPMMSLEDITNLPIESIANENSWCFLWTTQKYLYDAKPILENWGFKYLLLMTWKKEFGRSAGMPLFGFRWNSEFILVGYKGKKPLWVKGKPLIKACFSGINRKHSQKPDEFYKSIEILGEPRIDLFARQMYPLFPRREGWDYWGNEVESDIELL